MTIVSDHAKNASATAASNVTAPEKEPGGSHEDEFDASLEYAADVKVNSWGRGTPRDWSKDQAVAWLIPMREASIL
jgi:hypothetical protein